MKDNAKIALAVGGGYLLGRTKKAKLAVGLGMWLAGKKINFDPRELSRLLSQAPAIGGLTEQVRGSLAGAGKQAAGAVLTRQADRFADSLSRRAAGLRGQSDGAERNEPEDSAEDQTEQGAQNRAADESGQDQPAKEAKPKRARTSKATGASAQASAKGAAKGAASGARRAARTGANTPRRAAGATRAARSTSRVRSDRDG